MSHLLPGYVWDTVNKKYVTADTLNAVVGSAALNPVVASPPTNGAQNYLLYLNNGSLYARTWNAFCSGMGPVDAITFSVPSGNPFKLVGGASNLLLNEVGTSNYPMQILNGATSNSLYLTSTGVGVRKTTPAEALDVSGNAVCSGVMYSKGLVPRVGFFDTNYPTAYQGMLAFDALGGKFYIGSAPYTDWSWNTYPVVLNTRAPNYSIVLESDGNVGIGTSTVGEKLTVNGNVYANGSIKAVGDFYQGTDQGLTGTLVVTGTWNGGSSGSRTLSFKGGILTGVT